jgi:hypothetical protein
MLLAVVTVALGMTARWRQGLGVVATFGLYGALHATLIVAALREPQTPWRKVCFILMAAGLAMLCVVIGLFLGHRLQSVPAFGTPAVLLTLSSGLGAASYGVLIRRFWMGDLSVRSQVCITLCCGSAMPAALPPGAYLHILGTWWFAMVWWWSFSIALWCQNGRPDIRRALAVFRQPR